MKIGILSLLILYVKKSMYPAKLSTLLKPGAISSTFLALKIAHIFQTTVDAVFTLEEADWQG